MTQQPDDPPQRPGDAAAAGPAPAVASSASRAEADAGAGAAASVGTDAGAGASAGSDISADADGSAGADADGSADAETDAAADLDADASADAETDAGADADAETDAGADSGAEANASTRVSALRITVARSGGVAGVRPSWSVTAEREADVDSWLSLVESCPWDAPDPDPAAGGGADRFVYTIRVVIEPSAAGAAHPDAAAPREHDARVPERALDGPWGTLVDRVKDASRR